MTSIILVIAILLFVNIAYAKYITTEKISTSTDIAVPIFIVQGDEKIEINKTNNIGYYEFVIRNFNDTFVSEENFLYTIEIISNLNDKISFELYNEDIQIPLQDLKTNKISINGNEKIEHKYKLKIIYDDVNNLSKDEIFEEVQIKVHSEQEKR